MADLLLRPDTEAGRWELADRIARGENPDEAKRIRRRSRLCALLIVALPAAVIGAAVGVAVATHRHARHVQDHHPDPAWRIVLGVILVAAGFAGMAWGFWRLHRAGLTASSKTSPLIALHRVERSAMLRQVNGKDTLDPRRLAIARALATRNTRLGQFGAMYLGLESVIAANAVLNPSVTRVVQLIVLAVLFAFGQASLRASAQRAAAFLRQHPLSTPETQLPNTPSS